MSLPVTIEPNHAFMEESLEKGMELGLKSAQFIIQHVEGNDKMALLKKIENAMLDISLLSSQFDNFKNLARETMARNTETEKIGPVFETAVEEASLTPVNPKDNPYYKRLKDQIRNATATPRTSASAATGGDDDDDIEVAITSSEVNTIDPFTMKRMVNPLKNKQCGHVYDKDSVEKLLKKKRALRCPVVGCVVTSFTMKDLIPDEDMQRILQDSQ